MRIIRILIINTGGTLGMVGTPLRPAMSAAELFDDAGKPAWVIVDLVDFPLRQDSTNMIHMDRLELAALLASRYADYDGFVVLHGTDTLPETCAMLCMIFAQTLQKPAIPVGAQMSKGEWGSDAPMQMANGVRTAVAFALVGVVGVYTVSMSKIWNGANVIKRHHGDYKAFISPSREPVATISGSVFIRPHARRYDPVIAKRGLLANTNFAMRFQSFFATADESPYGLVDRVKKGALECAVLVARGSGNIPDRPYTLEPGEPPISWIDAIRFSTQAGVPVGVLSPFEGGHVSLRRYELGEKALAAGAIGFQSLTDPMGKVKFLQSVGMFGADKHRIERHLQQNIVGELVEGIEIAV